MELQSSPVLIVYVSVQEVGVGDAPAEVLVVLPGSRYAEGEVVG